MSGAAITVKIDDSEVRKALTELGRRMDDLTPAMQDIGETILESVQRNFEEHRGPDLVMWTRLSKKYEKWKTEKKGRNASDILILNRILMGSINSRPERRQVTVGTNIKYAAIHQFGGEIQKKARSGTVYFKRNKRGEVGTRFVKRSKSNFAQDVNIKAHAVNIPARPFLGIRNSDWPEINDAINGYLIGDM